MSNYRDDTQETIVLSSESFGKITSGDVDNLTFTETILSKIRHNIDEIIKLSDEDLSRRKVLLLDNFGFSEQIFHRVKKFQLIEEVISFADNTFIKQSDLINESLGLGEVQKTSYRTVHIEPFNLSDAVISYKSSYQQIYEQLYIRDSVQDVSRLVERIEDNLTFSDSTKEKIKILITETINLGHAANQKINAYTSVNESIKFTDRTINLVRDSIIDVVQFRDDLQTLSDTVELIVEQLTFSDYISNKRTVKALLESQIALSETVQGVKRTQSITNETLFLDDLIEDGRNIIGAWTATADGWNMSRYHDFPYEQLIVIDGRLYGVTATGIEELKQGAQNITAQIKTAKLDIGDGSLVHPESMILEYSLDGQLSVDIGTTQTGYQQTFNYALRKEPSDFLTNGRVIFGRGLRGRHFEFTVNLNGSTAYINDMVVNVSKTKRRI